MDDYDLLANNDLFAPHLERIPVGTSGLQGTLFVAGLSECGSEFHLGALLSLPKIADYRPVWPEDSKRYLHIYQENKPEALAEILDDNKFDLIVIVNLLFGKKFTKHKGLAESLRTAVTEKGAYLVLFCCEKVQEIYSGLFKKTWKEADYTRTTYYQTQAARKLLPDSVSWFNAKSILLDSVPPHEKWYTIIEESTNDNLIPQIHGNLQQGLTSVAKGICGKGRVVFLSDVNAEADTCSILVSLAQAIFPDEHLSGSDSDDSISSRDVGRAQEHRCKGNAAFEVGDLQAAIDSYTYSIAADHRGHIVFSNRALAYLKLGMYAEAKNDCTAALELSYTCKTLLRRATAYVGLHKVDKAILDFRQVLLHEPNNREAQQQLSRLSSSNSR